MLRRLIISSLLCIFLAKGARLTAQTTSTIQGNVTDPKGFAIAGAEITLSGPILVNKVTITSDATGSYRLPGLQAGTYDLQAGKPDFATKLHKRLDVTVNRLLVFDIVLALSTVQAVITVSANPPLLETHVSSSGTTILPQQIEQMPINGRNYLDLLQLVPGIAINRQQDASLDGAAPILGETTRRVA